MNRLLAFIWLLVLCALAGHARAQSVQALHLTDAELLTVEGYGFSPPPYSQDDAKLTGTWTPVQLPYSVRREPLAKGSNKLGPATVVTWYRIQVPAQQASAGAALYIQRWKTDGQIAVYGDGRVLYQSRANYIWNGSNLPLWIALTDNAGATVPRTLLIRIERLRHTGGGISSLWIGGKESIGWRYRLRLFLQGHLPAMSMAAFLSLGIFSLLVWLLRRHEKQYVLFSGVTLAASLRMMHYFMGSEAIPVSEEWFSWVTLNSMFWTIAAVHLALNHLHQRKRWWLDIGVLGLTALLAVVTLPITTHLPSLSVFANLTVLGPLFYAAAVVIGLTAYVLAVKSSWQVKSKDGLMVGCWALAATVAGVFDWLQYNNFVAIEGAYLGQYMAIGCFIIFAWIMFRSYMGAIAEVEQVNASLESRLKEREAELTANHERLRAIEQLQMLNQERQRLMQDMHDGMGSSLTTALRAVQHGRMTDSEVEQLLKGCIDDLKLAIDSMESVDSDLVLLLATLRFRLGPRLQNSGIALRWEVAEFIELDWLDPKNALHILRILQEAFTNVIKHTNATEICVATELRDDYVTITVTDNGGGFTMEHALRKGGKGLSNQRRRAQSMGAEVSWESGGEGTRFALRLPMSRPKPAAEASIAGPAVSPAA